MKDKKYNYAMRYTWTAESRTEGFTKDDITDDLAQGLSDSMLCISILNPPDGSYSQETFSFDGKTDEPLTQNDIFKAWMLLGLSLSDNKALPKQRQEFVDTFAEVIRSVFKGK